MTKITNKRFLKYISLTKNSAKEIGRIHLEKELENILETKKLSITNIPSLFIYLFDTLHNPERLTHALSIQILLGYYSLEKASEEFAKLKKENQYMYKVITKYFTLEETSNSYIIKSIKNNEEVEFCIL